MLDIRNLTVTVDKKTILENISYHFKEGKTYIVMGPNGSGKSTLAYTLAGHPHYIIDAKSNILFKSQDITSLSPDKRAALGIFLSFQSPLALQGVTVFQLLRVALQGQKDAFLLKTEMMKLAKRLKIPTGILERSLNQSASGGEKKKLEVLQAGILSPRVAIFDEVDTGVDVDALNIISSYINDFKKGRTIIFITHNSRILKYIKPDKVLILKEGKIVKEGGKSVLSFIEKNGFGSL